ncbi:hypothetical protein RSOL_307080 [Rhizoctonia solani AG-3 Rhs1AP]|uniref:Uncharacterized protein n=1 Tax=Rhizoctonia solani AG-3 Rhs1AP TaxID=1086054 RepID=A0A0A1ULT9_9AGAM|nr:hypothetical protein RSOL_307080 [Rhizoctonia solani AG-3 Rhs1AP]
MTEVPAMFALTHDAKAIEVVSPTCKFEGDLPHFEQFPINGPTGATPGILRYTSDNPPSGPATGHFSTSPDKHLTIKFTPQGQTSPVIATASIAYLY